MRGDNLLQVFISLVLETGELVFPGGDKHSSEELPLAHSVHVRFVVIEAVDVAECAGYSDGVIVVQFDLFGSALL